MRSRALTGTTEGSFDKLLVRSPADTGAHQDVLTLISNASSSYDDTALQADIVTNTTSIGNLSTSTTAALAGKVDDSQVLTDVPANAVFTDTVYSHPLHHPISMITGLQAALDGKVDDSQVLTNIPANTAFMSTVARLMHARAGTLPLQPTSDCLCYFPLNSDRLDLGPAGLNWVLQDTSVTPGTYATYTYPSILNNNWRSGWDHGPLGYWEFPNRNVPVTQITSSGIGGRAE